MSLTLDFPLLILLVPHYLQSQLTSSKTNNKNKKIEKIYWNSILQQAFPMMEWTKHSCAAFYRVNLKLQDRNMFLIIWVWCIYIITNKPPPKIQQVLTEVIFVDFDKFEFWDKQQSSCTNATSSKTIIGKELIELNCFNFIIWNFFIPSVNFAYNIVVSTQFYSYTFLCCLTATFLPVCWRSWNHVTSFITAHAFSSCVSAILVCVSCSLVFGEKKVLTPLF